MRKQPIKLSRPAKTWTINTTACSGYDLTEIKGDALQGLAQLIHDHLDGSFYIRNYNGYGHHNLISWGFTWTSVEENKNYESELVRYNKNLKIYEEEMAIFNGDFTIWDAKQKIRIKKKIERDKKNLIKQAKKLGLVLVDNVSSEINEKTA